MKVAILGAGVMGLTLAHRLSKKGIQADIFEIQPQIGGLSTWFDYEDFVFDKYYHVILKSDQHLIRLIDELGLSDRLFWKETKTGFLWEGKHVSMSNHWEFLTFPVINLFDKFRLGTGILYSQHMCNPDDLHTISATQWMKNIFGNKVYGTVWEPLLESKFGVLKEEVPAITLWSILNRYYSTRKGSDGKEMMGHLKNEGLKSLFDALSVSIKGAGGNIYCGHPVEHIQKSSNGKIALEAREKSSQYDRVISTVPTAILKRVAPGIQGIESVKGIPKFLGVIRLALVLKESLSPFYVTNLIDKGFPFTGIIEVSALTDVEELGGKKLVMIPRYDTPDSEWFDISDEEITSIFLEKLRACFPDIDDQIVNHFVHREKIVQAIWMDPPPSKDEIPISSDNLVWSVNSELCGGNTLNNNAIIDVANGAAGHFLRSL